MSDMQMLPPDFVALMQEHLGSAEAEKLCAALMETEPEVSIRLNTRKLAALEKPLSLQKTLEPVPWCPDAFYLTNRPPFTFDPLFHAGAYYVQEASSMYLAEVLHRYFPLGDAAPPCVALDLCAAPGGKSTLLASLLPPKSLLISNEPMPKRAQVLAENICKWTGQMPTGEYPVSSVVTQNYPIDFRILPTCFDLLVVDAPCSGEGMFRKDEQAIRDWSLHNVELCVRRQQDILETIWDSLKPGGLLVYSTCTFNRFEDEDNARFIFQHLGGELLHERHFLPGADRGEGFYIAAIRKHRECDDIPAPLSRAALQKKLNLMLRVLYDSTVSEKVDAPRVELSYNQAIQYLRRESIRVDVPRGPVQLCYQGLPLGMGKSVGSRINNLYPQEWRIRTTYTQEYSLFAR